MHLATADLQPTRRRGWTAHAASWSWDKATGGQTFGARSGACRRPRAPPSAAHPRKRLLKIAASPGCTSVRCWARRRVAAPAARWPGARRSSRLCPPPLPTPQPRARVLKKTKLFQVSAPPRPCPAAPQRLHGVWVQAPAGSAEGRPGCPPPRAPGSGRPRPRRAPGYFYSLPPARRLHAPARLQASMNAAVEALSSCEHRKERKKNPRGTHSGRGGLSEVWGLSAEQRP